MFLFVRVAAKGERMGHITFGLLCIALGLWGMYDVYYYVLDFLKGAGPVFLMACGVLATLAGCVAPKNEEDSHE